MRLHPVFPLEILLLLATLQACANDEPNPAGASDGGVPTVASDVSAATEPTSATPAAPDTAQADAGDGTASTADEPTDDATLGATLGVTTDDAGASTPADDGGTELETTGEGTAEVTTGEASATTNSESTGGIPTTETGDVTTTGDDGEAASVHITEATGQEVSLELPPDVDTTTVIVLLYPDAAPEDGRPVPSTVEDGEVIFRADEPGTYKARSVTLRKPDGCSGDTWAGSLNLTSNLDVAQLQGYSHLSGSLTISSTVSNLEPLRCLTEITGNLDVTSASNLTQLSLPNLVHLRGRLYVYNAAKLTSISLPELALTKGVTFSTLPELTTLSLPHLINTGGSLSLATIGATAEDALDVDFSWLVSVPGEVSLASVVHLETLDGFRALQEVTTNVDIRTNGELVDGTGLASLERVGAAVTIYNNASLETIDLGSLREYTGSGGTSLNIQSLPELVKLDVGALRETPGGVYLYALGATSDDDLELDLSTLKIIRGNLDVQALTNLVDLDGLGALAEVTGSVDIRTNAGLESAAGLAELEDVGGTLIIYNNASLEVISLAGLQELGGNNSTSLNIQALPELVSLDVSSLEETPGGVYLYQLGATASDDLEMSFDSLEIIRGNLDVQGAANLVTLDGFSGLEQVTGAIDVRTNASLASAAGFAALASVGRGLVIYNNAALTEISLASLEDIGANGSDALNIQALPELVSLDVSSLVETAAQVYVYGLSSTANSALSLDFSALEVVRSTVTLQGVSKLTTVDGFSALEEIGGNLVVYGNPDLVSIGGFDNLTTLDGNLDVRANALLSQCQPLALRNRLQTEGFDGTATISSNLADTCD